MKMSKLRWNFEAAPFQAYGTVGPALDAGDFHAEGVTEDV